MFFGADLIRLSLQAARLFGVDSIRGLDLVESDLGTKVDSQLFVYSFEHASR